jgi:putative ABC transport system permease protein
MNIGRAIIEALESLSANKLRSGLTILGIVIGVAAVIAMLAVGQGAQSTITGTISGIGTNLLFVFSGNQNVDIRNPKPLTIADMEALADPLQAPSVEAVSAEIQGSVTIAAQGEDMSSTVEGITPSFQTMRNYTLYAGDFINDSDLLERGSVVIIGSDVADKLFGTMDGLIGETVRISGQPFKIIGVLTKKGGSAMGSQDNTLLVPFTTAQARLLHRPNQNRVDLIYAQATSSDTVKQASDEITSILRTRHNIMLGDDDFTVYSQEDIVNTAKTVTNVLTIFLGGIAGISLLVGGIGIMNIMLVSVTERTREIGLRKALGARRRDILTQFLTESALLSLFGGILGIGLGFLIAFIVGKVATMSGTPFTPVVGVDAILLATIFSTVVGLFFGLYPANRAAALEPVEALRYE